MSLKSPWFISDFFNEYFFSLNLLFINIDVGILGDNTGTCGRYVCFSVYLNTKENIHAEKSLLANESHGITWYTALQCVS